MFLCFMATGVAMNTIKVLCSARSVCCIRFVNIKSPSKRLWMCGQFNISFHSSSGYASARDMHQNDLGLAMSTRDRFNVLKPSARNGLQVTTSVLTRSKTPDSKRYGEMVSKVVSSGQAPGQRVAPPRRSTIHTISTKNKVRVPSGSANVDNVPLARNRRKSIHAINAAGTNDPTLASGNGMNRRCDVAYRRDRRNSIDCTYHVSSEMCRLRRM